MRSVLLLSVTLPLLLGGCGETPSAPPEPVGRPIVQTFSAHPSIIKAAYGASVSFQGDKILRYPHFDLLFLGTRLDSASPLAAHVLTFEVRKTSRSQSITIAWHPNSGDSSTFSIEGRSYRFGVEDDQIYISPERAGGF